MFGKNFGSESGDREMRAAKDEKENVIFLRKIEPEGVIREWVQGGLFPHVTYVSVAGESEVGCGAISEFCIARAGRKLPFLDLVIEWLKQPGAPDAVCSLAEEILAENGISRDAFEDEYGKVMKGYSFPLPLPKRDARIVVSWPEIQLPAMLEALTRAHHRTGNEF